MTYKNALPEEAWLAALMSLPEVGPARLRAILADGPAIAAWDLSIIHISEPTRPY